MTETSPSIDKSLAELRQRVEARHGAETEITPEHVQEFVGEHIESAQQKHSAWPAPHEDTPSYQESDIAPKAQELRDIAFSKDLATAVQEAVNTHNPAIVKAFHDLIADELFQQLVDAHKLEQLAA